MRPRAVMPRRRLVVRLVRPSARKSGACIFLQLHRPIRTPVVAHCCSLGSTNAPRPLPLPVGGLRSLMQVRDQGWCAKPYGSHHRARGRWKGLERCQAGVPPWMRQLCVRLKRSRHGTGGGGDGAPDAFRAAGVAGLQGAARKAAGIAAPAPKITSPAGSRGGASAGYSNNAAFRMSGAGRTLRGAAREAAALLCGSLCYAGVFHRHPMMSMQGGHRVHTRPPSVLHPRTRPGLRQPAVCRESVGVSR